MSNVVTLQPRLDAAAAERLIADVAAAALAGQTFGSRREAIVAIATTLRAQHLQLHGALQELRANPETDPAQRNLLALLEAKGCGVLATVTAAIQATDSLLETPSQKPGTP